VAVCADPPSNPTLLKAAAQIALDLSLPFLARPLIRGIEMLVVVTPNRLELRVVGGDRQIRGGRPLFVNTCARDTTSPAGRRVKQPIAKAIGLKRVQDDCGRPPTVIDATAGWGMDSLLLTSLGCHVLAVERHKVLYTLLQDGILRAKTQQPKTFANLTLVHADAQTIFHRVGQCNAGLTPDLSHRIPAFGQPDVVYLDPMFPPRRGKGAETKTMRVLRRLVGNDDDASAMFNAALSVPRRRIVVKRPLRAKPITQLEPTVTHNGKSMRYDVYVV